MTSGIDIKDLELNALLEITQAINNNLSEEDLFRIYRFTLLADLKVTKMAMFVKDVDWICKVHFGSDVAWGSETLPKDLWTLSQILDLKDRNDAFNTFDQAIPVTHKNRLLAIVFVAGLPKSDVTSSSTFLKALTNILMVAIQNKKLARQQLEQEAYRKELEIAKKVQNFLFPKALPQTQRLKVEAVYLPHQDVGGDYYDYLSIDNDRFLVCVADVSGKGVPAALLMSNFQASLRTLIRKTQDPKEIVEELNYVIGASGNGENFITFVLAIYDFASKKLEYVNCGHNPLYILRGTEIIALDRGTTILGMFDPLPFLETVVIEDLTDFFFFGYTDGLSETFNAREEQFGEERIIEHLNQGFPDDLNLFHQTLLKNLDAFRDNVPYGDDITILSCLVHNS